MGLGFIASKEIALGLGTPYAVAILPAFKEVLRLMSYIRTTMNLTSEL